LVLFSADVVRGKVEVHLGIHAPEVLPMTLDDEADAARSSARALTLHTLHNGAPVKTKITPAFVDSPEYSELLRLSARMELLGTAPFTIEKGSSQIECETLDDLVKKLDDEARKGHSIQRYKGLGEMNPEQLWETTMNPENRSLLQVKIQDAVEADQVFSDLMGDEVEPRRLFIEKSALDVVNLDI
jgi:DNA gyrase subunit B